MEVFSPLTKENLQKVVGAAGFCDGLQRGLLHHAAFKVAEQNGLVI
jgi:hypothetical protein